jgi:AcrR family transcriptional regulator
MRKETFSFLYDNCYIGMAGRLNILDPGRDEGNSMQQFSRAKRARRRSGPGRLSAEDLAQLPDRLLDAAAVLFLKNGYAKATMEGIAREARASTKTVYSRYQNKAEILAAVIRRLSERTLAKATTDLSARLDRSDPQRFLREFGLQFATLVSSPETAGINRLVIAEAAAFPELVQSFAEGPARAVAILRAAMEQWQAEGRLPLMPEPQTAAAIYYDMATSTPRMRALLGAPMSRGALEAHIDVVVDLFLRGCAEVQQRPEAVRGGDQSTLSHSARTEQLPSRTPDRMGSARLRWIPRRAQSTQSR